MVVCTFNTTKFLITGASTQGVSTEGVKWRQTVAAGRDQRLTQSTEHKSPPSAGGDWATSTSSE